MLSPIKMFAIINRKQKTNFGTKPWSIRDDGQAEALIKKHKSYWFVPILLNFKYKRTKIKQVIRNAGVKITPKNNIPKIFFELNNTANPKN